ncbi:MAG: hypothetical protein II700_09680, partial [Firmicutes bacterium]|nr:hypothetical protein [Bacillota bacterium]
MAESTHKKRILSQTKTIAFAFRVTGPKAQRLFVCVFPGRKQPDRHLSAKENLRLWTKAGGGSLSYIDILRHIAEEAGVGEDIGTILQMAKAQEIAQAEVVKQKKHIFSYIQGHASYSYG